MMIRKPAVENKYHLKPKDIERAIVLKPEALHEPPFWRNNVVHAWCLNDGAGKDWCGDSENSYWIGFYDNDAPDYKGKIRMYMTSYGGMCGYDITEFFKKSEIENVYDLEIQEKLLSRINWLIDEKIIRIPKNKTNVERKK